MLSDRHIKHAKPGKYADEGGLYLRVYESGKKAFMLRRQEGGKDTVVTLGHYPTMGLAEARRAAGKLREGKVSMTLRQAFAAYYSHLETQFKDPGQTLRMVEKDILTPHGDKPIDQLERSDYTAMLQVVTDRGSPVMANRLLTQIKRFLAYCEDKGWVEESPIARVRRRSIGGAESAKDRTLSWEEITDFFRLLPANKMDPGTRWALYFCLLTGCRGSEAIWCLRNKTLMVPFDEVASIGKTRAHKLPPTRHVRAVIRLAPPPPKDHRVLSHALRRLNQTFTPHDLRRTFATRMADLSIAPHVIEKLLNHSMTGVLAVYNRAEYWPERLTAQALWDKKLRELRRLAAPGGA